MAAVTKKRIALNLALLLILRLFFIPAGAATDSSCLIVDGVEYSPSTSRSGDGWTYTYSSGMGYLRLNGYLGGAICLPVSASVEFDGDSAIIAAEGEPALSCAGDTLILGSSDPDASLTIIGGSGAQGIFGHSVSLWGWGRLSCCGGSGASAVWGGTAVLAAMEQMVLCGDAQMAITTDLGGVIRVSGAHKYYAGMSAATAVESQFYGGEFYLRAEPARAIITFDANGGTVNGEETYTDACTVTTSGTDLMVYTPEREHYIFSGWSSQPDGSGHAPPPRLFSGGEFTYYAQWDRIPILLPDAGPAKRPGLCRHLLRPPAVIVGPLCEWHAP